MSDVDKFQLQEEAAAQRAEQAARDRRERNAADLREAPLRGPASRERSTRRVPLATIHPVENIRADLPEIHELARSIREVGLLTPLLVQPWQGEPPASAPDDADVDHYRLIAGHRRHAALRALADAGLDGYDDVACEVAGELSEAEAYALMLTENVQRVPLEPIQAARALRLLLDLNEGMTAGELARSLGLKPAWVQKHLKLLELPEDVQQRLADGDLSITVADLLRRGQSSGRLDEAQVRTMAREVSAGTMTAAEVRAKAAPPRPNSPAPRT